MGSITHCWPKRPERRLALVLLMALAGCGPAAEPGASVAITHAALTAEGRLSAGLAHQFSQPVLAALHHGVSLSFEWRLQLRRARPGLWDPVLWEFREVRELSYRSLSQRYTLSNPRTGTAASFPDLNQVLRALNRIDQSLESPPGPGSAQEYLRLRARLVISRLPPALRLPSYLSTQWRMDSGWHEWPRA